MCIVMMVAWHMSILDMNNVLSFFKKKSVYKKKKKKKKLIMSLFLLIFTASSIWASSTFPCIVTLSLFFFFFSLSFLVLLPAPNEVHGMVLVFGRVHGTFCIPAPEDPLLFLVDPHLLWRKMKKHKKNNKHKTTQNST